MQLFFIKQYLSLKGSVVYNIVKRKLEGNVYEYSIQKRSIRTMRFIAID
ncbi:protein of unknown function [[Clostridium] ultunense Esp]|uniref:Uncharacterized protein n=1 Tax=[Clostridium] ultunense Esp TaxID=1288971 RepID=A0A1M4PK56_9FIRM|nr:protein of unknown function [[Clostridium] ultunense Esp]